MSGGSDDDYSEWLDDLFPGEGESAAKPEEVQVGASRSAADDVLEAVTGVKPRVRPTKCPMENCSGTLAMRGAPLGGGTVVLRCPKCRLEIPWATVQSPVVEKGPVRAAAGPFYTETPPPRPNGIQPAFRIANDINESKKR